jgi:hypothetical protein
MSTRILLAMLALLTLRSASGCHENNSASSPVPQGKPAAIDGTLAPGEWDSARTETLADSSELLLMYDQGYLYLGIRSSTSEMIVGNVFINQGDEIRILHTSAALGTAIYARAADHWQQTQTFDWRCRRTDQSDAAQAERDLFLQDEGWISINSRMGTPNELEYKTKVPSGSLRLAANLLRSSDPDVKVAWPSDLDDDCVKPTPGGLPAQMQFSPDRWAAMDIP